jgi:hypothetical protein
MDEIKVTNNENMDQFSANPCKWKSQTASLDSFRGSRFSEKNGNLENEIAPLP